MRCKPKAISVGFTDTCLSTTTACRISSNASHAIIIAGIECTPEAAALTLSGKLDLKDDLTEVLKILSVTAPIQLQIISPGNFRIDYNPASSRLN